MSAWQRAQAALPAWCAATIAGISAHAPMDDSKKTLRANAARKSKKDLACTDGFRFVCGYIHKCAGGCRVGPRSLTRE